MNNDKNIMNRSTMLSLKFLDKLDQIDVCMIERRLEDAVTAHADGMQVTRCQTSSIGIFNVMSRDTSQMCVQTESGPVLSAMEAELRERGMKLASVIDAAVQAHGAAAMPLARGIQALSALGFGSRLLCV